MMTSEINNVRIEQYLTIPFLSLSRESRPKSFFESLFSSGDSSTFLRITEMEAFVPLHLLDFVSSIRQEYHLVGSNPYDAKSTTLFSFVISLNQSLSTPERGIRISDFKKTEKQSLKLYFQDESVCELFNMKLHAHCCGVRIMEKVCIGREQQFFLSKGVADQLFERPENEKGFSIPQLMSYSDFVVDGIKVEKMRTTLHRSLELIHKVQQTYKLVDDCGFYKFELKED